MTAKFVRILLMFGTVAWLLFGTVAWLCNPAVHAAQAQAELAPPTVRVPRLIPVSGLLTDNNRRPLTGVVGVTFGLYQDQSGGAPLWLESQNIELNEAGRYTALLGAATAEGLPMDLFTSGEARWLSVRPQVFLAEEQARVLVVSVPYALKAADADTIGGKPASAFVLAQTDDQAYHANGSKTPTAASSVKSTDQPSVSAVSGTGTTNLLAKWLETGGAGTLGDSALAEIAGNVGINTPTPAGTLDVRGTNSYFGTSATGARLWGTGGTNAGIWLRYTDNNMYVDADQHMIFRTNGRGGLPERMRLTSAGDLGIGTNAPAGTLDVRGPQSWFGTSAGGTRINATGSTNAGIWVRFTDQNMYVDADKHMVFRVNGNATEAMRILNTGNVGIGTITPTQKLDVAGTLKVGGSGIIFPDLSTLASANAARVRGINYIAGCETCSLLTNGDDQPMIFQNVVGPMTINAVTCYSDAGSPQINLQVSGTNILSSPFSCSTTGALGTIANSALGLDQKIDFVMVDAGTSTHRVTVVIKATVN